MRETCAGFCAASRGDIREATFEREERWRETIDMGEMGTMKIQRLFLTTIILVCSGIFACAGSIAQGQASVPVISGGVGFLSTTNGGTNYLEPIIVPVLSAPLGDHLLVEARGELLEFSSQATNGGYQRQYFNELDYTQLDYTVNSWLTIVGGRFLTPFGMYNERLIPIWIHNLQDPPLIFVIGTRTSSSSLGGMVRGAFAPSSKVEVNYAAYFSAADKSAYWGAGRAAGFRTGIFLPNRRLEIGMSYQRFLQGQRFNSFGAHLSWQPYTVPLDVKAEFAHSASGYGYWAEVAYRLSRFHGAGSAIGRLQPVFRMQQFFRLQQIAGDSLPGVSTQQADFGFDYYLPHQVRINSNYSRQFSSQGNVNIWDAGITYRFMFPLWPGGSK